MAIEATEGRGVVDHKSHVYAVTEANKELIYMKEIIRELEIRKDEFRLHCDNQRAIHRAKNSAYHWRTKIHLEDVSLA